MKIKKFLIWLLLAIVFSVILYICHQEGFGHIPQSPSWSSGDILSYIVTFVFGGIAAAYVMYLWNKN
jgi:membrane protein DedA with SNARE-associated domain